MRNNLRKILEEKGVSYRKLADVVGIAQSSIYRYINGRVPQLDIAIKISEYLGVKIEDIWPDF